MNVTDEFYDYAVIALQEITADANHFIYTDRNGRTWFVTDDGGDTLYEPLTD